MNKKLLVTAVVLALGINAHAWADTSSDNGSTSADQSSTAVSVRDSGNNNPLSSTANNSTNTTDTTNMTIIKTDCSNSSTITTDSSNNSKSVAVTKNVTETSTYSSN